MKTGYIDAHLHLQDERLTKVEGYPENLIDPEVQLLLVNGTSPDDWEKVSELAAKHPKISPSFGLHPWWVGKENDDWFERLISILDTHPKAGIGEIGLDKWIRNSSFEKQKEVFEKQLHLATDSSIPPTIHCLKAWGTMLEMLTDSPIRKTGFLLHSYSGPPELVSSFLDLGAYFSISGYFARPDKVKRLEAWRRVPIDRLFVETDAPDMSPPSNLVRAEIFDTNESLINHPRNIISIYQWVADFYGIQVDDLKMQVIQNFNGLFNR